MKSKWLISFLIAVLVVAVLSACSSNNQANGPTNSPSVSETGAPLADTTGGSNDGEVTEIEFDHAIAGTAVEQVVEAYHQTQNKVRVKPVYISSYYDELMEKLQAKAVANQLPDLFTNGYTYTQFAIDQFPVTPLQTFIDSEHYDTSDFFPNMLDYAKGDDGKIYGFPFAVSSPVVILNDDLFKAAGLDPANPPKTWDEVRETAKKLTKGDQYGVFYDYPNSVANWMFQAMLQTAGGSLMKDTQSVGFNSSEGRMVVQYLHDLQTTDRSMPNLNGQQAEQSFLAGKIAMFVTSSGRIAPYSKNGNFAVSTAVFPTVDGKTRKVPAGGSSLFVLAQDPKKQAAAWDFIKFATSPEGTAIFAKATGFLATRQSAVDKPELMGDYLQQTPDAYVPYTQVSDSTPWRTFPGSSGPKIDIVLRDNTIAAVQGEKTVEQALSDAEKQANALLKE